MHDNASFDFRNMINSSSDEWIIEDIMETYNSKPTHERVRICLFFLIFITGLSLNVILVFQQWLKLRTMSRTVSTTMPKMRSILLINLGFAQIMQSFWASLAEGIWHLTHYWYAGNIMCKLVMFLRLLSITSSGYSVVAVLLAHVIYSQSMTYGRFIYLKILLPVWTFSTVVSIPTGFLFNSVTVPYNKAVEQCVTFGSFSSKAANISYNVICLILIYGAPLLITIVFVILGIVFKFKGQERNQCSLLDEEITPIQDDETELNGPIRPSLSNDTRTNSQSKAMEKNITPYLLPVMYFTFWMPHSFAFCHALVTYHSYMNWFLPWSHILGDSANVMIALCSIICTMLHV